MAQTAILSNFQDSYALQSKPSTNYNSLGVMALQDGAFGYMFYSNPVPPRARVLSAKLRVRNVEVWGGSITLRLQRLSEKFSASRLNWNNRPGVTGTAKTLVKSNAPARTVWEFDITDWVQLVADGGSWYGFRIDANGTTRKRIYSSQSTSTSFRPEVEIVWADEPQAPTDLQPRSNLAVSVQRPTLRFDFTDTIGSTTMRAFQVQFNADGSGHSQDTGFAAPSFDTGEVLSDVPQYDTTVATPGGTWAGLLNGANTWWTVRVQDDAGLWSKWSKPAQFSRVDKAVPTIINPVDVVEESTPPLAWDMPGQTAYQIKVLDPTTYKVLWDTGKVTSTQEQLTVPEGVLTVVGKLYRVLFQFYDNVSRATTPNDPPYVEAFEDFTFTPTPTTSPTSNLTVARHPDRPTYLLEWDSATMPDDFAVLMDGEVIGPNLHPADVLESGTHYTWEALKVPGRQQHTFEVARVVNGKQSSGNPTVTVTVKNVAPWLMEKDGSNAVMLLDPVVDPDLTEESDVLYPQDAPPVLVTQSQWGYVGTVSGVLTDENLPGLTARELRDRLLAMRKKRGATFYLLWQDEAVECAIYNVAVQQVGNADGSTDYPVSFGFVQVDYR